MGVVALMVPIAVNLAKSGAFGLEIGTATVVGGAVFGDNLSMISDTTIASVSSQEASAKDKLKMNSKVALIASIITLIYLAVASNSTKIISISNLDYYSIIKIIPYISLIIMGLLEVATLVTITINIIIAGVLGITFLTMLSFNFLMTCMTVSKSKRNSDICSIYRWIEPYNVQARSKSVA